MAIDPSIWSYENEHLKDITEKIQQQLKHRRDDEVGYAHHLLEARRNMWKDVPGFTDDLSDLVKVKQYLDIVQMEENRHNIITQEIRKLEKIGHNPYFARIDFEEDDADGIEKIYIGITTLFDEKTKDVLLHDWRAPISSIFYEFELGSAFYKCLEGKIDGKLHLKRQFQIFQDHIEVMFDSSLKIDDEILQSILSQNVDDRMRTIVTSIQKEQNRIIRDETSRLLIVQGAAGSGKTSIALHRVAYFLYKYKEEKIQAGNIVIFSPNQMFNDYISNVLPELGEENMKQTTFMEYAQMRLGAAFDLEDKCEQMEYVLSNQENSEYDLRMEGIFYKSSMKFLQVLRSYVTHIEQNYAHFTDINHRDQMIISGEDLHVLYHQDYSKYPVTRRMRKLKDRILFLMRPVWKARLQEILLEVAREPENMNHVKGISRILVYKEFKVLRDQIDSMLYIDVFTQYTQLFMNTAFHQSVLVEREMPIRLEEICKQTLISLNNKWILYEDVPALVFLKGALEGVPNMSDIQYVVIDEAQDYTPVQYEIFHQIFKGCSFTILGDLNQAIHPYMKIDRYEWIQQIFQIPETTLLSLKRSYRSTWEITEFSKAILPQGEEIESLQRMGEKPQVQIFSNEEAMIVHIAEDIVALQKEGYESIAVLCKTATQCIQVHSQIDIGPNQSPLRLIVKDEDTFHQGLVVLPVYLAKGLEFDAVILYEASAASYGREIERKLFYVACTRALHRLHIYATGLITPFIENIDAQLYRLNA